MAGTSPPNEREYVVCLRNDGYPVSLDALTLYGALPDPMAPADLLRVIDESGEDYLYPRAYFAPIQLPSDLKAALQHAR